MDDMRHLFETNFWGVVYASLEAARHLKGRVGGGALINVEPFNSKVCTVRASMP